MSFSLRHLAYFIITLQLLCVSFFVYYINTMQLDDGDDRSISMSAKSPPWPQQQQLPPKHPPSSPPPPSTHHSYATLSNFRAHFNDDPNVVEFGSINEMSLSGVVLKISSIDDNALSRYQSLCDVMPECIGFSTHPSVGVLFHNQSAFPLQYIRNWQFHIKNTAEHRRFEMPEWHDRRLSYRMPLISSAQIPSMAPLNLAYAVPIIPRKFMSFEWNAGRVNNQLFSVEAMLQYAVLYHRTIVIPFASHRNHDLGIFLNDSISLWDMLHLSAFCDYIFEYEVASLSLPSALHAYIVDNNNDINYEQKRFEIELTAQDLEWKSFFENVVASKDGIQNEPNYNLLALLEFRAFTNNDMWTLAHENLIQDSWNGTQWQCYVSRGIRAAVPHQSLTECRLLNFCLGRFAHFKLDDWPVFDVFQFWRPSPRIRQAVDNHIKFWFEHEDNYRVGVHRRAMKEGGSDKGSGSPYVCRFRSKSLSHSGRYGGLRSHIERAIKDMFASDLHNDAGAIRTKIAAITDLYDQSCAITHDAIQQMLSFHAQPILQSDSFVDNRIAEYKHRKNHPERWFLACDNQEAEYLQSLIEKHHAITLNGAALADFWKGPLYWNMAGDMQQQHHAYGLQLHQQYLKYLKLFASRDDEHVLGRERKKWLKQLDDNHQQYWWYDMSRIEFWRREIVVFDMWMLRRAQFFVGSWHSTLTRSVCHWRGYDNMYNSTHCYLVHKWRAMRDVNAKEKQKRWFDLNAVDRPKLTWND